MRKKIKRKVQIGSFLYRPDYIESVNVKYSIINIEDDELVLQSEQKVLVSKIKKRTVSSLNSGDTILYNGKEIKIKFIKHVDELKEFFNIKKSGKFDGVRML